MSNDTETPAEMLERLRGIHADAFDEYHIGEKCRRALEWACDQLDAKATLPKTLMPGCRCGRCFIDDQRSPETYCSHARMVSALRFAADPLHDMMKILKEVNQRHTTYPLQDWSWLDDWWRL